MTFASDLDPAEVKEEALVSYAGPWRRDLSVLGHPLTLGQSAFDKGLGVHSRCLLTYACEGQFDSFAATVGIDAETNGKGDCIFQIMGDGKELFNQRVRAGDSALPVSVKVAGIKRVTLAVEPGEDLDIGDHADWCDARFVKDDKAGKN